jgi:serine/threonine-protein kinase RsbW
MVDCPSADRGVEGTATIMSSKVVLQLTGPMDHLRLIWQTGETLLDSVVFDDDPEGTRYNVLVALQEMVTNVLRHGYELDETRPIEVVFELSEDTLQIVLRDQGPAFDPLAYDTSECSADQSMPQEAGGFGIHIARAVMDTVQYSRENGWNTLRLSKCARVIANT